MSTGSAIYSRKSAMSILDDGITRLWIVGSRLILLYRDIVGILWVVTCTTIYK